MQRVSRASRGPKADDQPECRLGQSGTSVDKRLVGSWSRSGFDRVQTISAATRRLKPCGPPCSKLRRDAFPRLTSSRRPLAMASVVGEKEIDLTKLNIQQLSSLKGELEQEVENLTRAYATLKDAQSRLMSCRNTVTDMGSTHSGTEILVPLTQSMYVPGRIADSGKVLIDIGTGYYVEKSLPKAKEYLDRRLTMVGQNVDSLQKVLVQKEQTVRAITGYMQRRFVMRQEPEGGNS